MGEGSASCSLGRSPQGGPCGAGLELGEGEPLLRDSLGKRNQGLGGPAPCNGREETGTHLWPPSWLRPGPASASGPLGPFPLVQAGGGGGWGPAEPPKWDENKDSQGVGPCSCCKGLF